MSSDTYELNCPFCDKLYKLPREKVIKHAGKSIHCRKCGEAFSIPTLPPDEPAAQEEMHEPAMAHVFAEMPVQEPAPPEAPEPAAVDAQTDQAQEAFAGGSFSTSATFEPPPLSEYSTEPTPDSHSESPGEDRQEQFEEASAPLPLETAGHDGLESSSHFDADAIALAAFSPVEEEPVSPIPEAPEPLKEEPIAETSNESREEDIRSEPETEPDGLAINPNWKIGEPDQQMKDLEDRTERVPIEAPPPPVAPPVRAAPPPPRPRRPERVPVTPMLIAEEEDEPAPRRRGRFGLGRSQPTEPTPPPVEKVPQVATQPQPPLQPPVEEERAEPALLEVSDRQVAVVQQREEPLEPGIAPLLMQEDPPGLLAPQRSPPPVSPDILDTWVAIRRVLILLAVASVLISVTLIAILLAIVGIIPKK